MIQEGKGRTRDAWSTHREWTSHSIAPEHPGQISVLWGVKRTEPLLCFCRYSLKYGSGQAKLGFLYPDLAGKIGTSLAWHSCRPGRSGTKIPRPARSTCLGSGMELKAVMVLDHNLGTLALLLLTRTWEETDTNITASFRRTATR